MSEFECDWYNFVHMATFLMTKIGLCVSRRSWNPVGSVLFYKTSTLTLKSSFLSLLMGELDITSGNLQRPRRVSISPQEPWIFSGSIRENILMAGSYDSVRYQSVIEAVSLGPDLELFTHGDLTLVGEKGVTLSGGQKARVGLARAVYAEADIYLLDDPLASVDAKVAAKLYKSCINEFLRNKTRVLVTNHHHFLSNANSIILLKKGKQTFCGTYDALMSDNPVFANSVKNLSRETVSEKK